MVENAGRHLHPRGLWFRKIMWYWSIIVGTGTRLIWICLVSVQVLRMWVKNTSIFCSMLSMADFSFVTEKVCDHQM